MPDTDAVYREMLADLKSDVNKNDMYPVNDSASHKKTVKLEDQLFMHIEYHPEQEFDDQDLMDEEEKLSFTLRRNMPNESAVLYHFETTDVDVDGYRLGLMTMRKKYAQYKDWGICAHCQQMNLCMPNSTYCATCAEQLIVTTKSQSHISSPK